MGLGSFMTTCTAEKGEKVDMNVKVVYIPVHGNIHIYIYIYVSV